jgi:HAE1 family hydrophobic/amphiphilic exporter-1
VTVGDVAEVVDGVAEIDTLNRINGRASVGIIIQKQADANAVEVSEQIRGQIATSKRCTRPKA